MAKKQIVICCHAAMATSSMIEACVKEFLEKNHIDANVEKVKTLVMDEYLNSPVNHVDLIIPNGRYVTDKAPVVSGMPYLTGVGIEEMEKKFLEILTKED